MDLDCKRLPLNWKSGAPVMAAPEPADPAIILGEPLSAVAFVRDYVEFHFDGPVLRAISNPRVEVTSHTHDRRAASHEGA
jgi:hypothetical protein